MGESSLFRERITFSLSFDGTNSKRCRIPKPIIEFLGEPENLKFVIRGKGVIVTND